MIVTSMWWVRGLSALAIAGGLLACSDSTSSNEGDGGALPTDPVARGEALVNNNACSSCHGVDLAGAPVAYPGTTSVFVKNITSDVATGIGGWTAAELVTAIRTGVAKGNTQLCSTMTRYQTLSDTDANAMAAYLLQVKAVSKVIPVSSCDGSDAGSTPDAGAKDAGAIKDASKG